MPVTDGANACDIFTETITAKPFDSGSEPQHVAVAHGAAGLMTESSACTVIAGNSTRLCQAATVGYNDHHVRHVDVLGRHLARPNELVVLLWPIMPSLIVK